MKKTIIGLLFGLLFFSCSKDIDEVDNYGTVFGIVSDRETGAPISNVSVELYEGLAWDCLGQNVGITFTGTDGFFQITDVNPERSYFIVFSHSDYQTIGKGVGVNSNKKTEVNQSMNKITETN